MDCFNTFDNIYLLEEYHNQNNRYGYESLNYGYESIGGLLSTLWKGILKLFTTVINFFKGLLGLKKDSKIKRGVEDGEKLSQIDKHPEWFKPTEFSKVISTKRNNIIKYSALEWFYSGQFEHYVKTILNYFYSFDPTIDHEQEELIELDKKIDSTNKKLKQHRTRVVMDGSLIDAGYPTTDKLEKGMELAQIKKIGSWYKEMSANTNEWSRATKLLEKRQEGLQKKITKIQNPIIAKTISIYKNIILGLAIISAYMEYLSDTERYLISAWFVDDDYK